MRNSGFSRQYGPGGFATLSSLHVTASRRPGDFPPGPGPPLVPVFPLPAPLPLLRPRSSGMRQYRNLNLLSIGYASRPRLRPRLTQGRSASPWKPRIFGLGDSHPHLATHSGILSPRRSTGPCGPRFAAAGMLPYQHVSTFLSFGGMFQPRTFSAQGLSTSELLRTL